MDSVKFNSKQLDCLMYADDIIIFSLTSEGLQNKLFSLENYCDDWGMNVNIKKTKIITFNKAGRTIKEIYIQKLGTRMCTKL